MTMVRNIPSSEAKPGPWSPLQHRAFLLMWIATVISNTGTWMNDVGAAWLMTELNPTPLMVALIQSATTLPVFCFALIAGVLTDRLNRRSMMLFVNGAMALVAILMATIVAAEQMTPGLLLAFTFLLNTGAAFLAPVWLACVPSLVPARDLPSALALNSMGINISRAIGPSLAGIVLIAVGLWGPFVLNAVSFVGILLAVYAWSPEPRPRCARRQSVGQDLRDGLRYSLGTSAFRAILIRAVGFFLFASAYWALLPLIARDSLSVGSAGYGLMMGAIGAGAVMAAFLLPGLRRTLNPTALLGAGTAVTGGCLIALAMSSSLWAVIGLCGLAGMAWIAVLSTFHIAVQTTVPDALRGRGVSVFLTVFFGSMALGSVLWGAVATRWDTAIALTVAGTMAVVSSLFFSSAALPGMPRRA